MALAQGLPATARPGSASSLLAAARAELAGAAAEATPARRYAGAHLAALRAAAAVIAAYARPAVPTARARPVSAWALLVTVAPELSEWAAFFAAGAARRAAADAGIAGAASMRQADDLLRDAETFVAVVETKLRGQPALPLRATS